MEKTSPILPIYFTVTELFISSRTKEGFPPISNLQTHEGPRIDFIVKVTVGKRLGHFLLY